MQIHSSFSPVSTLRPQVGGAAAASVAPSAGDSVSFSEDSVSLSGLSVKGGIIGGLAGVIPLVGVASNFGIGAQAGFNGLETATKVSAAGIFANLGGTISLAGGLIFGNETAKNVGLSLLGVSGLAGAFAGMVAA